MNLRPPGYEAVSRTNRSHFGSDLCVLQPFARWIFRCFRPDLPAPILFWVKSGSSAGTIIIYLWELHLPGWINGIIFVRIMHLYPCRNTNLVTASMELMALPRLYTHCVSLKNFGGISINRHDHAATQYNANLGKWVLIGNVLRFVQYFHGKYPDRPRII